MQRGLPFDIALPKIISYSLDQRREVYINICMSKVNGMLMNIISSYARGNLDLR